MIIKCHRVRTRGGQRKRLLEHLLNGEDNEEVQILQGSINDVDDAFADARRLGREYAVRHMILSPGYEVSDGQMLSAVVLLGQEFGFEPKSTVQIKHFKARAAAGAFDQHLHLLVPEVDPATGTVLSSSHTFQRHEKLARILEQAWGHPFTSGAHNRAVILALKREGRTELAASLEAAFAADDQPTRQAYSTADQQRLKRAGYDLPALRGIIGAAWYEKTSKSQFKEELSKHGLTVELGDKPGTYVVRAATGELVGALHRLTRLRKEAVHTYMEEADVQPRKAHNLRSDLLEHADHSETASAAFSDGRAEPSTGPAERTGDVPERARGDSGRDPATSGGTGSNYRAAEPAQHRQGRGRSAQDLSADAGVAFELALVQHQNRLQIMLGQANALSHNHTDRVAIELAAAEERARSPAAMARSRLPEPRALADAREAVKAAGDKRDALEGQLEQTRVAERALSQPTPWWRRAVDWLTGATARREAERQSVAKDLRRMESLLTEAETALRSARQVLAEAETRHAEANRELRQQWAREAADAAQRLQAANAAAAMWQALPGLTRIGPGGIRRVGERIIEFQARHGRRARYRPPSLRPQ